jgi:hypothetical protein
MKLLEILRDQVPADVVRTLAWPVVIQLATNGRFKLDTVDNLLAFVSNPNYQGTEDQILRDLDDPNERKQVLTDELLIKNQSKMYSNIVKHYFKDNSVLMNKWLRYADNIRSL